MGPIGCPETSLNTNICRVTSQKRQDLISATGNNVAITLLLHFKRTVALNLALLIDSGILPNFAASSLSV